MFCCDEGRRDYSKLSRKDPEEDQKKKEVTAICKK